MLLKEAFVIKEALWTYNELSKEIEQLNYRDKFRLAQLLIQLARAKKKRKRIRNRGNHPAHQPSWTLN